MIEMIVLGCVCRADVISEVTSADPTSLLLRRLNWDAGVLLDRCGIIRINWHEWGDSI